MVRQFERAVVTGGAGFLGSRVCQQMLEQGTAVVCLDNFLTGRSAVRPVPSDGPRFEFRFCDVAEPFGVDGPVDLVLHLASPASAADYLRYPLRTLESGSSGTRNALQLAARKQARFVLGSASAVYGDPQISPLREDYRGYVDLGGPRSAFDQAKRYAEALTWAYERAGHADTAIARIFGSYGPGMRPDGRMVPTFAGCCCSPPATCTALSTSGTPRRLPSASSPRGSSASPDRPRRARLRAPHRMAAGPEGDDHLVPSRPLGPHGRPGPTSRRPRRRMMDRR